MTVEPWTCAAGTHTYIYVYTLSPVLSCAGWHEFLSISIYTTDIHCIIISFWHPLTFISTIFMTLSSTFYLLCAVVPYRLIIQDDGNLVLYDANDALVGVILHLFFYVFLCFCSSLCTMSICIYFLRLREFFSRVLQKQTLPGTCLLTHKSKYKHMQYWISGTSELPSASAEEEVVLSAGAHVC